MKNFYLDRRRERAEKLAEAIVERFREMVLEAVIDDIMLWDGQHEPERQDDD